MKKIIEAYRVFQMLRKNINILKVVEDIFNFVKTTSREGQPMTCKIALFNTADGTKVSDFVSLWAGIGESNPVDRVMQLRRQKDELQHCLKYLLDNYTISDVDRKQIELTIKYFNL
jgi:hypothetical protein